MSLWLLLRLPLSQQPQRPWRRITLLQCSNGSDQKLVYHLLDNCIIFITRLLLKHVTAHQKINNARVKIPS